MIYPAWMLRILCFESISAIQPRTFCPPAECLLVDAVLHFNVTEPRSCPLAVSGYSSTPQCPSAKIMLSTYWVPVSGDNSTLHRHSAKIIIMVFTCSVHARQFYTSLSFNKDHVVHLPRICQILLHFSVIQPWSCCPPAQYLDNFTLLCHSANIMLSTCSVPVRQFYPLVSFSQYHVVHLLSTC